MPDFSSYLRRGGLALVALGLGGFAADYGYNVGLSRLLSTHEYGDYKVAHAFAVFFGTLVLLGGDRAAPKALAGPLERGELVQAWEYLRFYLRLSIALSVVVIAVTWSASFLHVGTKDPLHHHALAWLVVSVPLLAAGALTSRTLQSARRPVLAALPWRVGLPVLLLVAIVLLARAVESVSLWQILVLAVGVVLVVAGGQWLLVRRVALPELKRDPRASEPRRWLATSVPMMGFFLVTLTLAQSDLYFLEILGDEREVGLYAAAQTTAHFLVLIQTTVVGLVAPLVSTAIESGGRGERETHRQAQRMMLTGLLPAAVLVALAGRPILSLFGPGYPQALTVLHLLLVGNFVWATAAIAGLWLQFTGRGPLMVVIAVATLAVDSVLNVLLIPDYGMGGAALGTAITLSLAGLTVLVARHRSPRL